MLQLLEESGLNKSQHDSIDTIYRSGKIIHSHTHTHTHTHTLDKSGQGLLRIINSILDFSKIDTGHLDFETNPFELNHLVADAVAIVKAQQGSNYEVKYIIDMPSSRIFLVGDDTRLFQVLV